LELGDDQTSNQVTYAGSDDASGSPAATLPKSIWRLQIYVLIVGVLPG